MIFAGGEKVQRNFAVAAGLFTLTFVIWGAPAAAQVYANLDPLNVFKAYDRGRNTSVLQRERPEYDPVGVPAGSFLLYPQLSTSLGYVNNILATKTNTQSDGFVEVAPSARLVSQWTRNSLVATAGADLDRYFSHGSENENAWYVNAVGRYDAVGESYLQGGAEARRDYQERTDVNFPTLANQPIPVNTYDGFFRGVYQQDRLRATALGSFQHSDFSSVDKLGGGTLDQSSRNVNAASGIGRLDYAVSPDTAVFVDASYHNYSYPVQGTFNRDAHLWSASAGANFDLTALVRGEIGIGYTRQTFANPAFKTIEGLGFHGRVEYFPTQLTTLTLTASRGIDTSVLANTGGFIATNASLRVDHELLRNLLLNANFDYENDSFHGADRTDHVYTVGGGFQYLVSHSAVIKAGVNYISRTSSGTQAGREFNVPRLTVSLVLRR